MISVINNLHRDEAELLSCNIMALAPPISSDSYFIELKLLFLVKSFTKGDLETDCSHSVALYIFVTACLPQSLAVSTNMSTKEKVN